METESLIITRGSIADAVALTQLSVTTFLEAFGDANRKDDMDKYLAEAMNITQITEELKQKDILFFLAWYNDQLTGYAKMSANNKPEAADFARPIELERIYVLREHYGKRIGAALMNICLTHAISHNCDTIWLGVWERNLRAVNFYRQWGFEFYGAHQFRLGDDLQTDRLMKKGL